MEDMGTDRNRLISRRGFIGAITAAAGSMGLIALAGCGAPAATPTAAPAAKTDAPKADAPKATEAPKVEPTPAAAAKAAAGTVQLRKMAWGSALEKENIEKGLAEFMKANPNIKVEYIHVPQDYDAKLQTMLAAGNAPEVFKVSTPTYPDFIKKGALLDITDLVTKDDVLGKPDYFIMPWEKDRSTIGGRWYGIGSCAQYHCLYYNVDMLKKAGVTPPSTDPEKAWTWDDFVAAGKKLTIDQAGKHPGETGFDVTKVAQWGLFYPTANYNSLVFSNGGNLIDPTSLKYVMDKPEVAEAIQAVADLALKHQVAPKAAALQELGMNSWQMLASGKVAIINDGNWALLDIAKMNFAFGAGANPKFKKAATQMSSSYTGVYKATKTQAESFQLFRYLNLDDYQIPLVKVGLWGPSHKSLLTADGVKKWLTPGVHPEGWEKLDTDFKMKYGVPLPNVVGNLKASTVVTQGLDPVWIGQKTAKDACAEITTKANKVLEEEQAG